MEWSKDKTLQLIELLQINPSLWNPTSCDSRRDKQKRKEELRTISEILGISVADTTKKIQHLRTQYNRESSREARANAEDPNDRFVSNWYAFEYLHFLKDTSKAFKILHVKDISDVNGSLLVTSENSNNESKLVNLSPQHKTNRSESLHVVKPEILFSSSPRSTRDEFTVFGEYIANELRSLKGEKNLLVAKKKIQDVIFEVKMDLINEIPVLSAPTCTVYTHNTNPIHSGKHYTTQMAHIEPISTTNTTPPSSISEIIINNACHYSTFKVDNQ